MFDFVKCQGALRRPGLLLRAAMAGQADYERNRDLKRLIGSAEIGPQSAVARLAEAEQICEDRRIAGEAAYSAPRHVALLIALLAEQRMLRLTSGAGRG